MKKIQKMVINNHNLEVELADSFFKRSIGLMFRKNLHKNKGMLFIFNKERVYKFWMMNVNFHLDIIWIDSNFEVVYIKKRANPCKILYCPGINPKKKAKYVLEINGGLSDEIGIDIGDKINLRTVIQPS